MAFESDKDKQYWPDEALEAAAQEEQEILKQIPDEDCCIPMGRVALGSEIEQDESPIDSINDRANALVPKPPTLTSRESSQIDRLVDTGQCSVDDAYRKVTGLPSKAFYESAQPFDFVSRVALEIANKVLSEKHPRESKQYRSEIVKASAVQRGGMPPLISSQEAVDLMRLIELRNRVR